MVANRLHAATILLREGGNWDWFINLGASNYPLVTQDDLLLTFCSLSRDLNFIDHISNIGWKEFQRAKPFQFISLLDLDTDQWMTFVVFFEGCGSIIGIDCLKFLEIGKFNGIATTTSTIHALPSQLISIVCLLHSPLKYALYRNFNRDFSLGKILEPSLG
ncbi:unnamed protein product [Lactuca virosa]|uniref:Uncharacterized protein n=1 Tax=Lactuca virosa TaxID=75947 RepID=A0AAU9LTL1_9ASTR|nr:unnamed protein product [Lactuca virosa]